jgi:sugar O-acyltransferase (sialic acid O-acetyltransferase NeuD family)
VDDATGLVIVGAGGCAREVAWLVDDINRTGDRFHVAGFLDRLGEAGRTIRGVPVFDAETATSLPRGTLAIVAVGNPALKPRLVAEVEQLGLTFATLVHPSVRLDQSVRLGLGSIVCAGAILTLDIEVGAHVIINMGCTVGHDSVIGDFSTISPGCHVSGDTRIGKGVLIGAGATTIEHTTIGDGSTVGAGAVVTRDLPPGVTAVGIPARARKEPKQVTATSN